MNKIVAVAIAGAFVVTTGLTTRVAAQPAKSTATQIKETATSKVKGERAEEKVEDQGKLV